MMKKLTTAILTVSLVALQGWTATIITTGTGQGADSHIDQGNPAGNFGTNTSLLLKDAASGRFRKSYLKFDLSSWGSKEISEATIDLATTVFQTPAAADFTVGIYGVVDAVHFDNWGELTITGQNAPANSSTTNGFNINAIHLGDMIVPFNSADGTLYSFSSQALIDWLSTDTDGLVTIGLNVTTGNSETLLIASKENGTYAAPTLTLVPEPTTLLLGSMGGLLFILRRKRNA